MSSSSEAACWTTYSILDCRFCSWQPNSLVHKSSKSYLTLNNSFGGDKGRTGVSLSLRYDPRGVSLAISQGPLGSCFTFCRDEFCFSLTSRHHTGEKEACCAMLFQSPYSTDKFFDSSHVYVDVHYVTSSNEKSAPETNFGSSASRCVARTRESLPAADSILRRGKVVCWEKSEYVAAWL